MASVTAINPNEAYAVDQQLQYYAPVQSQQFTNVQVSEALQSVPARIVAPSVPLNLPHRIPTTEERAQAIARRVAQEPWAQKNSAGVQLTWGSQVYQPPPMAATPFVAPPLTTQPVAMKLPPPTGPASPSSHIRNPQPVTPTIHVPNMHGPLTVIEPSNRPKEVSADWSLPNVRLLVKNDRVCLQDELRDKRGIIFGVPGAFTPVCTHKHMPGFREAMPILRRAVEYVACVAVNDPHVLKAWAKELGCPKDMVMISDWEGKFVSALGLELDASAYHMGMRCRRFCILVSEGSIVWFGLEEDAFVDKVALVLHHLGMITDENLETITSVARQIDANMEKAIQSRGLRAMGPPNEEPEEPPAEQSSAPFLRRRNEETPPGETGHPSEGRDPTVSVQERSNLKSGAATKTNTTANSEPLDNSSVSDDETESVEDGVDDEEEEVDDDEIDDDEEEDDDEELDDDEDYRKPRSR